MSSAKDLWPSGKATSNVRTKLVEPKSGKEVLEEVMAEVKKTVAEQ